MKKVGRILIGIGFLIIGVLHFTRERRFRNIVPHYLPFKKAAVLVTGVCEIWIGIKLLLARPSDALKRWINYFLLSVFPANIYMARRRLTLGDKELSDTARYGRLPLQFLFMYLIKKL